jgi:hypothetical protein
MVVATVRLCPNTSRRPYNQTHSKWLFHGLRTHEAIERHLRRPGVECQTELQKHVLTAGPVNHDVMEDNHDAKNVRFLIGLVCIYKVVGTASEG